MESNPQKPFRQLKGLRAREQTRKTRLLAGRQLIKLHKKVKSKKAITLSLGRDAILQTGKETPKSPVIILQKE